MTLSTCILPLVGATEPKAPARRARVRALENIGIFHVQNHRSHHHAFTPGRPVVMLAPLDAVAYSSETPRDRFSFNFGTMRAAQSGEEQGLFVTLYVPFERPSPDSLVPRICALIQPSLSIALDLEPNIPSLILSKPPPETQARCIHG